jgi:hypothetical protein
MVIFFKKKLYKVNYLIPYLSQLQFIFAHLNKKDGTTPKRTRNYT